MDPILFLALEGTIKSNDVAFARGALVFRLNDDATPPLIMEECRKLMATLPNAVI